MEEKKEMSAKDIEKLKKKFDELNRIVGKLPQYYDREAVRRKKEGRKYIIILSVFVVLILLVDLISLYAYYRPNLPRLANNVFLPSFICGSNSNAGSNSGSGNSVQTGVCKDGTKEGSCSSDKPLFCYHGELLKSAHNCGCPSGYEVSFQDCVQVNSA